MPNRVGVSFGRADEVDWRESLAIIGIALLAVWLLMELSIVLDGVVGRLFFDRRLRVADRAEQKWRSAALNLHALARAKGFESATAFWMARLRAEQKVEGSVEAAEAVLRADIESWAHENSRLETRISQASVNIENK